MFDAGNHTEILSGVNAPLAAVSVLVADVNEGVPVVKVDVAAVSVVVALVNVETAYVYSPYVPVMVPSVGSLAVINPTLVPLL